MVSHDEESLTRALEEVKRLMREPGDRTFTAEEIAAARERASEQSRKAGEYMLNRIRTKSGTLYR